MGNVIRYRKTQEQTLEDFILQTIDDKPCKYCTYYEACKVYFSDADNITGCSNFDNTIEKFEQIYKENYC